ncbi:MAG: hypothetical protein WAT81_02340 [Candidatus Moraniibacteriota bacterium]
MPTSKAPGHTRLVSDALIGYAEANPAVLCNLRFGQRPIPPDETDFDRRVRETHHLISDQSLVYEPVRQFLKALPCGSKVLLHFQGYGAERLGTAVVAMQSIYWTSEDYPRLDFEHPPVFDSVNGCPNFWGAFILAIAAVPAHTEVFACRDRTSLAFLHLAKRKAVPIGALASMAAAVPL